MRDLSDIVAEKLHREQTGDTGRSHVAFKKIKMSQRSLESEGVRILRTAGIYKMENVPEKTMARLVKASELNLELELDEDLIFFRPEEDLIYKSKAPLWVVEKKGPSSLIIRKVWENNMNKSSDLLLGPELFDEIYNAGALRAGTPTSFGPDLDDLEDSEDEDDFSIETVFLQMISQGTPRGILDIADLTIPAGVLQDPEVRNELHSLYGRSLIKSPELRFYVKAVKDSIPLFVEGDQLTVHFPSDSYIIKTVSKLGGYPFDDSSPMAEILNVAYDRAIKESGRRLVTMKDLGLGKPKEDRRIASGRPSTANGLVFDPNGEILNQESLTTAPKTQFNILDIPDEEICDRLFKAKKRAHKDEIVNALRAKNFSNDRIETIYSLYRDKRDSEDLSTGVR